MELMNNLTPEDCEKLREYSQGDKNAATEKIAQWKKRLLQNLTNLFGDN